MGVDERNTEETTVRKAGRKGERHIAVTLGGFGAALAMVFAAAYGVGWLTGADGGSAPVGGSWETGQVPGGLQISERGYTLDLAQERIRAGAVEPFSFRVLDATGEPVTVFDRTHGKELHLIVARRDLTGYQHLHPTRDAQGTWSIPLALPEAGDYRVFADFTPSGDGDGPLTLGADVAVTGEYHPRPLPEPARSTEVDGYRVTLGGALRPGTSSGLTLLVERKGRPVTDLQPYLGAYGHLVALRSGDLGYLHVHPDHQAEDAGSRSGPRVAFRVVAPSPGTYRLFLDFKHRGKVRTAEFTAAATFEEAKTAGDPPPPADGGHTHGGAHGH